MPRLLLGAAAVAAALSLSPSSAGATGTFCTTSNLKTCVDAACARPYEDGCRQVDRCYYFTDYPTCIYQPVRPICIYPYDGSICVPWRP